MSNGVLGQFLGIPEVDRGRTVDGCDCWGLVKLVLREAAGIDVPSYDGDYLSGDEAAEVDALVSGEATSPRWLQVVQPRRYDVAIFRRGGLQRHAGIVLDPGLMLHMWGGHSRVERYDGDRWGHRLAGIYRWSGA